MNELIHKRTRGYTALRERVYRDANAHTQIEDAKYDLEELHDIVTVTHDNNVVTISAFDLLSDEVDAKRLSMVSGYKYQPMWYSIER